MYRADQFIQVKNKVTLISKNPRPHPPILKHIKIRSGFRTKSPTVHDGRRHKNVIQHQTKILYIKNRRRRRTRPKIYKKEKQQEVNKNKKLEEADFCEKFHRTTRNSEK
jgi:hypothetical protein